MLNAGRNLAHLCGCHIKHQRNLSPGWRRPSVWVCAEPWRCTERRWHVATTRQHDLPDAPRLGSHLGKVTDSAKVPRVSHNYGT